MYTEQRGCPYVTKELSTNIHIRAWPLRSDGPASHFQGFGCLPLSLHSPVHHQHGHYRHCCPHHYVPVPSHSTFVVDSLASWASSSLKKSLQSRTRWKSWTSIQVCQLSRRRMNLCSQT
ncbi:hypothetical protein BCR41DRAFT_135479 [Lobosporangium transversale]|uniref:Uncharacterized protein n=1 Tax=Lobosporangium transversale TaxID=64571 RepID=A0A1Y2GFW2_9FUNG|nr:hypothetical protein BCR41DRAFT_135479 [Lobosporangium transversale]ORZ09721.1 hypothetical protein BCR41DRAFT_135479 [Lobosporangium transversale]|eukprot:XP_021878991.1 hypothetical protein BCR41DRAFT_135479 [Lobosporangium transversale]